MLNCTPHGRSGYLAMQGEFAYGALNDPDGNELHSKEAVANPYHIQVTVVHDFLKIRQFAKHDYR
jgi:hypothetical protein